VFQVSDTLKKVGDLFVHYGIVEAGSFKAGEAVELEVDHSRRAATQSNHSATHLVHEALREVLGFHVAQKGSLVAPERLRFDFSHPKPMTREEIQEVEALANAVVAENAAVATRLMAVDDAMESGAMALFGEKYGDEVRVVSMGTTTDRSVNEDGKKKSAWSLELCGGTHVKRTGDIGLIHIVSETASASGIRRIEALTADVARQFLAEQDERIREAAGVLRTRPEDVVDRVRSLLEEKKQLERQLSDVKRQAALGGNGASAGGLAMRSEPSAK
jgi:alanyl-tRNA synthetase